MTSEACTGRAVPVVEHTWPERVYAVVRLVPAGSVTTYGDVAAALGAPRLARQVGFALAGLLPGDSRTPWHRVINHRGAISFRGDDGRGREQRARLEAEGVAFDDEGRVVGFRKLRHAFSLRSLSDEHPRRRVDVR